MNDYICKTASVDEMEAKWNYEIKKHKSSNWKIWKAEAIERAKQRLGQQSKGALRRMKIIHMQ